MKNEENKIHIYVPRGSYLRGLSKIGLLTITTNQVGCNSLETVPDAKSQIFVRLELQGFRCVFDTAVVILKVRS